MMENFNAIGLLILALIGIVLLVVMLAFIAGSVGYFLTVAYNGLMGASVDPHLGAVIGIIVIIFGGSSWDSE